jgi:hypothetical protein
VDEFDRFMSRQRALRRGRRRGGRAADLWHVPHWDDGPTEEHHPGRRKFSNEEIITIPIGMHLELTRRGEEEHPPLGADPDNPLERQGRLHLGLSDMHAALSDAHRLIGEAQLAALAAGKREIVVVDIHKGVLGWIARIAHDLARAAERIVDTLGRE